MGDGTLATFPTGSRAVDAAVHLAARVMSEAATGQILATSTAVGAVRALGRTVELSGAAQAPVDKEIISSY